MTFLKNEKQILNLIKYGPIVFVSLLSLIITILFIKQQNTIFIDETTKLKEDYILKNKDEIKNNVNRLLNRLINRKKQANEDLKEQIKNKVYEAHTIATSIFINESKPDVNGHTHTKEHIIDSIKFALGPLRFNNGRGYFFIYDVSGKKILHPIKKMEGKNLIEFTDTKSYQFVKTMVKTIKNKTETFDNYYWYKDGDSSKSYKKIGFYKYFEPLNMAIGAGEYIDEFENDLKKKLLKETRNNKSEGNKFRFIFSTNGLVLSHIKKEYINTNILNLKNTKGEYPLKNIIDFVKKNNNGYITYYLPTEFTDISSTGKISYITLLKDWNWVIGSGFHFDELNEDIDKKEKLLQISNREAISRILLISLLITMFFIIISFYISKLIKIRFDEYRSGIKKEMQETINKEELLIAQLKISEKLFNNLEVSIWNEDFSIVYDNIQKLKSDGIKNFNKYLNDNPEFIQNMANSIKVINVNKAALNMIGAKDEKEFMFSISKTFGANSLDVFRNELLAIWNEDSIFREEADFITLNNKELKGIVSFSIPKHTNDFKSIPVSILDVTQIKEKDKLILLQSRHAAMGEMISMIAHQWRQPITTISMIANNQILDLELDSISKEELLNYSNNILNQTKHLSETIDDFRNFFKVNGEMENTTIEEVIDNVLKLIKSSFDNHSIEIKVSIKTNISLYIKKRELLQVIISILNNSKDAFIINKINNALVSIDIFEDVKHINIRICDNAGGIKKGLLPKIFDPYFTTKEKQNGTGLGLYMSKIIVEDHLFGKIQVLNNKENGACFTISIPK